MPKASVKRLIGSDKDKLIELVLAVDKYPEFIPYCLNSKIYEKKDQGDIIHMIADLTIGKGIFKDTYKSDVNYNKKKNIILVKNLDGPLKYLNNRWVFVEKGKSTEVSFEVDFELKNKFLNILMTKSFQYGLDKIADAFQKRAEKLYKNIK
tara:strand:+ start:7185 stop:7637 length:453 start_codon:yes stop_codon:yes gene_type:complete